MGLSETELKEAERALWNIEMRNKDLQYDMFDPFKLQELEVISLSS